MIDKTRERNKYISTELTYLNLKEYMIRYLSYLKHFSKSNVVSEILIKKYIYLYNEEVSWASIGTRRAKISGPDTSGSEGLNGIPFTRDAPFNSGRLLSAGTLSWYTKSFSFFEELCLQVTFKKIH